MISYDKLMRTLRNRNITKMDLARGVDISNATLAKLSKNEPVTLSTIDKICKFLNCRMEDVVEYLPDEPDDKPERELSMETFLYLKMLPDETEEEATQRLCDLLEWVGIEWLDSFITHITEL